MSQPSTGPSVYPRPGIEQHADLVPSWLRERLHDLGQLESDRIQYEVSLGGLHNPLLNCHFPATSNFMVKPMSRLRHVFASNDYPTGTISIDFYDQSVEADDISPPGLGVQAG